MAKIYYISSWSLLLLILVCISCEIWCESANGVDRESAEKDDENAENIRFVPTKEWKKVRKGQAIPAGIHSRLNIQTGEVEAKLLDEDEDKNQALTSVSNEQKVMKVDEDNISTDDKLSRVRLRDMLNKISEMDVESTSSVDDDVKRKFRSYEEIKREFEDLKMAIKTDSEIISELLEIFKSANQAKEITTILTDLDYLLHQTDNAINFAQAGGLSSVVLPSINSSHTEVIVAALRLLGSASQSNPKVQIAALEAGAVESVLRLVTKPELSSSALHALSCVIRRFPLAQKTFVKYGGPAILATLFDETHKMGSGTGEDFNLRWRAKIKAVSLLHDLILEQQQAKGEASKQYSLVGLKEQIISNNWCTLFPSLLTMVDDHDAAEKGAEAMLAYWDMCQSQFLQAAHIVYQAEKRYIELSTVEIENESAEIGVDAISSHGGFYTEMAKLISSIGDRLRSMRDEL